MSSQNKEVLCTYHYDPLDCLIGLNSAKQDTLQRFYCRTRLATEIQGLARCSIVQQGDLLLAQQKRLGDALETDLWATDQQRSVIHTVGERPLPIVYSPYGHRRAESGLTSLLGFNGERPDAVTGHYLLGNGYRAFNPNLLRFNSPDSLSPFGEGGINAYCYCSGDPVNRSDPEGRMWKPVIQAPHLQATKDTALNIKKSRAFWGEVRSSLKKKDTNAVSKLINSEGEYLFPDPRMSHLIPVYEKNRRPELEQHRQAFGFVIADIKKLTLEIKGVGGISEITPALAKLQSERFKTKAQIEIMDSKLQQMRMEMATSDRNLKRLGKMRLHLEVKRLKLEAEKTRFDT